MTKRDEWVRVKSESELRAGMCVEIRPCLECGKKERMVLTGFIGHVEAVNYRSLKPIMCDVYRTVPSCDPDGFRPGARGFSTSIRDGRLYRLSDSQLTDSEETRELERVR